MRHSRQLSVFRMPFPRLFSSVASAVLTAFLLYSIAAEPCRAEGESELAAGRLQIAGARLTVSPESHTVPFDTPTVVNTTLTGFDPSAGTLPDDLWVVGDFTGPEISGVLELRTRPGEPFRIPRLSLKGQYRLDDIRLVEGGEFLADASPRSSAILATQVLVTRVDLAAAHPRRDPLLWHRGQRRQLRSFQLYFRLRHRRRNFRLQHSADLRAGRRQFPDRGRRRDRGSLGPPRRGSSRRRWFHSPSSSRTGGGDTPTAAAWTSKIGCRAAAR